MAQLGLETRIFDSKFKIPFPLHTCCLGQITIHLGDAPLYRNNFSQQLENREEVMVIRG